MTKITSRIIGTGSALPKRIMTNEDLSKVVDTSDEWIQSRTGIKQRHIMGEGETTASLAIEASRKALEQSGLKTDEIDLVIVATSSPDYSFPSVASLVQRDLSLGKSGGFDLQAACSGFLHSLGVAQALIQAGQHQKVLVIGAEKVSSFIDWTDRATCVLFGDGAGAVVLQKDEKSRGVQDVLISGDGQYVDTLYTEGGVATTGTPGHVKMNGREVYKYAVREMTGAIRSILERNNMEVSDIDCLIPHQANKRIIDALAEAVDFPKEKIVYTMDKHANTSAASIPLALDFANKNSVLKTGDTILFIAFGAGFSWSAGIVHWG